ncbi:hypothetical protein EVAR_86785_1 [Eumeta japonica]|uniref:Uncharacterized protein n=1 Tax=Eumeta variegata TaxID=151549 RepID=A0A4C1W0F2_EUMVA|nr:hypothetical protein EVAR_86785_1 [Eumeta japonica]
MQKRQKDITDKMGRRDQTNSRPKLGRTIKYHSVAIMCSRAGTGDARASSARTPDAVVRSRRPAAELRARGFVTCALMRLDTARSRVAVWRV